MPNTGKRITPFRQPARHFQGPLEGHGWSERFSPRQLLLYPPMGGNDDPDARTDLASHRCRWGPYKRWCRLCGYLASIGFEEAYQWDH